ISRSAINDEAGARTGISSMVSAAFVAATLLFFTPLFYYLPKALLAAIIVVAVSSLIDIEEAVHLWKNDRRDFLSLLVTFVATLSLGIQTGVFIGVLLSIALIIHRTSRPHHAVLGRLPDSRYYRNIHRFEEAVEHEEVVVVRFDSQLYFGNSDYFRSTIEEIVAKDEDIQALILDASGISDIDSSSLHTLRDIISFLETRDIEFYITGIIGPVRDILYKNGLTREIGTHNQFLTIHDAVKYHRTRDKRKSEGWTSDALQTNEPKIKSRLKKK
ncbi:MAG: STAS domain-containing protein, partial [Saprospiraceae bacterium]|nr:STAS domain-containing protein [Saprospiraceae bacterium]